MDLSCYERQPELVSLGYRSFYRDESSVSFSSDFEAPPPPVLPATETLETEIDKR